METPETANSTRGPVSKLCAPIALRILSDVARGRAASAHARGTELSRPDGRLHLYQSETLLISCRIPSLFISSLGLHADYDCIFAAGS